VSVYSDEPGTFDDRAQSVLTDVGRAVAFACNAMDRRRALVSGRATELALAPPDDDPVVDFPPSGRARRSRWTASCRNRTTRRPVASACFSPSRGRPPSGSRRPPRRPGAFTSLSLAAERDEEVTYDGVVDGTGLLGTLLDHAVVLKSVAPDGEGGRAVVRLPPGTDVASFVGMVQDRYPRTDLVARRDVEAESTTRADFRTALRERLTDRQWDALQMAYLERLLLSGPESVPARRSASASTSASRRSTATSGQPPQAPDADIRRWRRARLVRAPLGRSDSTDIQTAAIWDGAEHTVVIVL